MLLILPLPAIVLCKFGIRLFREKKKRHIAEAERLAALLGMTFSASGAASEPGMSLKRQEDGSLWSLRRRHFSIMYFTANCRALPCYIAQFAQSPSARAPLP